MNNVTQIGNKNKGESQFDPLKNCAKCRCNGSVKKWTYYFAYNRKAKICVHCAQKFSNPTDVSLWLERNAVYDNKTGQLIDFHIEVKQ